MRVMVEAADAAATATAHHGKAYVCVMSLSVVSTPLVNLPHVTVTTLSMHSSTLCRLLYSLMILPRFSQPFS